MKKALLDYKPVYYLFLIVLIVIALLAAILIKRYIGYAGVGVDSQAGNVTAMKVYDSRETIRWHGMFGLAFVEPGFGEDQVVDATAGDVASKIFVFECIDPNNQDQELYASLISNVSFANVTVGDYSLIDQLLFNDTENTSDNAQHTFTDFINVSLGSTLIQNIPATFSWVDFGPDGARVFYTGILNASGDLLLVTRYYHESQNSFKSSSTRFQTLLPTPNSSTPYYFFPDPFDECPAGISTGQVGDALVMGYVLDSDTLLPIANATVSSGNNLTQTGSTGFYNMTVVAGREYMIISIKEGYVTNISTINTTIGQTIVKNLTMARDRGLVGLNATISGYVRDNATNLSIANATINIYSHSAVSNGSGNFSFNFSAGTYIITAIKLGYENFIGNITTFPEQNISYFINMTPFVQQEQEVDVTVRNNGTINGFVSDNATNLSLSDVLVSVNGITNLTNILGFYNLSTYEGTTNLVATKSGYEVFIASVNITAFNTTRLNFSLSPVVVQDALENGSISGFVKTEEGIAIPGVFVSAAGRSNTSIGDGSFSLGAIPPGTHNIIAVEDGYVNYVAEVNVTSAANTEHNITMETLVQAGLGPGLGAGQGPGQGPGLSAGQGPGTGIIAQVEQPVLILDYDISIKKIIEKLRQDNFLTVPITLTNYQENTINVRFSVEGTIKKLIRLDRDRLTLDGTASGDVVATILGNVEPGIYEGFIVLSGDVDDKIPVYILVLERDRLPISGLNLKVMTKDKKINPGDTLEYTVDIQNLLEDESYRVDLLYELQSITTNATIPLETENIFLLTAFTLVKKYELPDDIELGQYMLRATAKYLGSQTTEQTIVEIQDPLYKYKVFGFFPLWMLLILLSLLGGSVYGFFYLKKRAEEKKRYHIDLDYNQLPKIGPRSAYVGLIAESTKKAYFDLDLMQTHTLVAGSTGSGKSVAAQGIVEEALIHGTAVMVFDPTVQWTGFLGRCQDKKFLELYPKFGLKKSDARSFNGNIHQILDAREMIEFDKFIKPSEINVFVVNRLEVRDYEIFVSNVIKQVFHNNMPESKQLKLILVFDEFHRLLPKYGGTGQVLIQVERAAREFRKWGVGLVLISQVISDFQSEVLANINTQIQMRTKDEGDLKRTADEYGERYLKSLVKAAVGTGMVENSSYNKGKPYFVSFKPLLHNTGRISDADLENYNKYNRIIDDLDFQLEQLEKFGIDIFDLQLELKLALDKVKAGSFNMVDIYLEGLKPRLKQQWEKLGKEPKKKEIKRISEAELKKELERAKKWRDKEGGKASASEKEEAMPESAESTETGEKKPEEESAENVDAISRAKAAREKGSEEKIEEKKPEEKPSAEDKKPPQNGFIDTTLEKIDKAIEAKNKQDLVTLYAQLQTAYKSATKDVKMMILEKCKTIQKVLSA